MKRILSILSISLLLTPLASCQNAPINTSLPQNTNTIQTFSSKRAPLKTLDSNKQNTNTVKPSQAGLEAKQNKGQAKQVSRTPIQYPQANQSRSRSSQQAIIQTASFALDSMNQARTYESGYNIGYQALKNISSQAYMARIGIAAAGPTTKFETAYFVVAYALQHIAQEKENTVRSTADLIAKMMDKAKTYEEGSQIGFETLKYIRRTATPGMRSFIDTAIQSANASRYWEDTYNTLKNAFRRLRTM